MGTASAPFRGATAVQLEPIARFNDSSDIAVLRSACGTFGVVCLAVFAVAFLGQLAVATAKLYGRKACAEGKAAAQDAAAKPEPVVCRVRHLGIIMDGNRRYGRRHSIAARDPDAAQLRAMCEELCDAVDRSAGDDAAGRSTSIAARYQRFLAAIQHTAFDGHRVGGEKLLEVVTHCMEVGIAMMTVYAFSTDNWNRPAAEVDALMSLFLLFFDRVRAVALERRIFVRFVSTEPTRLPPRVLELMHSVEAETRMLQPRRLVLNICVSYSGQSEVLAACNRILARRLSCAAGVAAAPEPVTKVELDREMLRSITQDEHEAEDAGIFGSHAATASVEPELILRTSGEQRVSNFLLYECAYSEFVFLDKTWPEVTRADIEAAITQFSLRDKRMGR